MSSDTKLLHSSDIESLQSVSTSVTSESSRKMVSETNLSNMKQDNTSKVIAAAEQKVSLNSRFDSFKANSDLTTLH